MTKFCAFRRTWKTAATFLYFHLELNAGAKYLTGRSSKSNKRTYYMASSASGQDDPNRAMWLASRAGTMEPSCPLGTTRCIPPEKFSRKPYNKSFIDQVRSVKIAGYWPRSLFASLWTSTTSRSITMQKKNLANIQPSWPHTWWITHTE